MNLGDTFVNFAHGRIPSHLWFVVSNPTGAKQVAIVNVSSSDDGYGDLPMLVASDHPWLTHDSFIRTDFAMLASVPKLQQAIKDPTVAVPKARATAATLAKLHLALQGSRHTKRNVRQILEEQELI